MGVCIWHLLMMLLARLDVGLGVYERPESLLF